MYGSYNDVGFGAGMCSTADGHDYWDHLEERHRDHRRHVRNLLVVCALVTVAGIAVHPAAFGFGAIIVPLLLIEAFAARRSRPWPPVTDPRAERQPAD